MIRMIPALIATGLLMGTAPAIAGLDDQTTIEVAPRMSAEQWSSAVTRELNGQLRHIDVDLYRPLPNAVMQVKFEIENGRPVNIRMAEPSGTKWLDRATLHSVSNMRDLPALPAAQRGWTVRANIISATDARTAQRMRRELQRSEATRIAAMDGTEKEIVLTSAGPPRG